LEQTSVQQLKWNTSLTADNTKFWEHDEHGRGAVQEGDMKAEAEATGRRVNKLLSSWVTTSTNPQEMMPAIVIESDESDASPSSCLESYSLITSSVASFVSQTDEGLEPLWILR
jgi:hypothetical protein